MKYFLGKKVKDTNLAFPEGYLQLGQVHREVQGLQENQLGPTEIRKRGKEHHLLDFACRVSLKGTQVLQQDTTDLTAKVGIQREVLIHEHYLFMLFITYLSH